ncbi:MAG: DNA polymerase I, partial [Firmicutes bacterium]|nr:DNA polymerase I [Bacillota bacterium]
AQLNTEFSRQEMLHANRVYELAGHSFNINSPKQLGEVLFEELGLPPLKKTKRGFSTDVEVLEQLAERYEIAAEVLEFRSVAKLRSTYAEGLQNLIADDGRLHTSFNQTVTATGRLSSTEPNLQNIPVRTEMGRRLRQAFCASPGHMLLAADYSQIELRVLAEIAHDEVLRQSFRDREDIHARTAAEVFGVPIEQVTPAQRRSAKAVNFGIVYGISDYGLSRDLGISRAEAKSYIDAYLERYEGVRQYMQDIVASGKEKGYVQTLCGRKRWLPDLNSRNFNLRSFAERTALNTPIQGTAADIIKLAMLRADAAIRAEGLGAKMLLQVHDELIFDVPEDEVERMCVLVREAMEGALPLSIELLVDMKVGRNWYEMQKL